MDDDDDTTMLPGSTKNAVSAVLVDAAQRALGTSIELLFGPRKVRAIGEARGDASAYAIRRAAEAKAYELVTLERARIEVEELRKQQALERAKERIISTEIRKQANMENILVQAIATAERESWTGDARPIDIDWMMRFLDGAGYVSRENLQQIWSKVLVRQAKSDQSTTSVMALDCLRLLDAELATTFLKAAALLSYISILSSSSLSDAMPSYPMIERTQLDRLLEIGLLQLRDREELHIVIGNAVCSLDKKCFEIFAPTPRFYSLTTRGFELATALIDGYQIECRHPDFALQFFTRSELLSEIRYVFEHSVLRDRLKVEIFWDDGKRQIALDDTTYVKNELFFISSKGKKPARAFGMESILWDFLNSRVRWNKIPSR